MDRKPLVMLIDDDPAVTEMYRLGLEVADFRVSILNDGSGLRDALEREVPDVIVLDWRLGSITGGDLLDQIRSDKRTLDTPVLMVSNYPVEMDEDRQAARHGALAWLLKARTSPQQLAGRLRDALPPVPEAG